VPGAGFPGQEQASGELKTQGDAARFEVHANLVMVPVTVTTGHGRVVPGLAKEDFSIFEDKVEQTITHFTSEDAPATIGLIVDTSDSMAPRIAKAKEAVYAVLRNTNPGDEFFLIRFSSRAELSAGLTSRVDEIRSAVDGLHVAGSTALLDAVKMGLNVMSGARHKRKAIIIISDGEDNSSRIRLPEFKRLVSENDTTIYALFIGDSTEGAQLYPSTSVGAPLLDSIARQTGGEMFRVSKVKHLPDIAAKIGSWIRRQYVLGYVPNSSSLNGAYHQIQVKISKPSGFPRLHCSWRRGYMAPS
jgi:Ca-activated chloride channel family protein